jgi:hypothetical protein
MTDVETLSVEIFAPRSPTDKLARRRRKFSFPTGIDGAFDYKMV